MRFYAPLIFGLKMGAKSQGGKLENNGKFTAETAEDAEENRLTTKFHELARRGEGMKKKSHRGHREKGSEGK